jgi:hypothetical protein
MSISADEVVDAVLFCCASLGRRTGRASRYRLANDILLLLHGIRLAVLWDHSPWDSELMDIHGVPPHVFLTSLQDRCPCSHSLKLVCIGPSLFLVHAEALTLALSTDPLPGEEHGAELVAVDRSLEAPRPCTDVELHVVREQLGRTKQALEGVLSAAKTLLVVPPPQPSTSMVAIHGWLLEYPIVYCYAGQVAGEQAHTPGSSCLSGCTLAVFHAHASRATLPKPHLVCSFSTPADEGVDGHGLELRPTFRRWRQKMQARFERQSCWNFDEVRTELCRQSHVVL